MTSTKIVDGLAASFGPYRIEELIGRGGMGEVYRAFDTRRNRTVALKVLPPETARDEQYRARFRRESDSAARLQDPHVIPIHDFGEIDGRLFIDMRLVDGVGLDRLLADGALDAQRAVAIVAQVAEALTDAHAHGVVHRDVKPSNVIVGRSDFVYLVDFGIARSMDADAALTSTGEAIGTLAYMAPERFDGGPPDTRSDIYALACLLAECLMGRRPFAGNSLPTLMKAHLMLEPPRPSLQRADVPPALDEVIRCGMAKDPAQRYQRAVDLAVGAQEALRVPATPQPRQPPLIPEHPRPPRPASALRGTAGVVGTVLAAALVFGGTGFAVGRATAPAAAVAPTAGPSARAALPSSSVATQQSPPARPGTTRPASYTYTIESNYPVYLSYTDSNGDQVQLQSVTAPWTVEVTTEAWGADARPILSASSPSTKGDTVLTCTITNDEGRVVASDTNESASAAVSCYDPG